MLKRFFKFLGFSPYEAANPSNRRGRVPGAAPTDAKKELSSAARRELVRKSRYLHKNSGFAREVVGDMAIYSVGDGIKPQAQTSDPDWNRAAEEYFMRWCQRADITGRFSFEQCQSLVCRGIDVDGEYFIVKVRDRFGRPRIQLVESHRISDAASSVETVDGIGFDRFGAPAFYRVQQDDESYRDIPSGAVMHVFEPESASGARSAPTLQHSINHLLDEVAGIVVYDGEWNEANWKPTEADAWPQSIDENQDTAFKDDIDQRPPEWDNVSKTTPDEWNQTPLACWAENANQVDAADIDQRPPQEWEAQQWDQSAQVWQDTQLAQWAQANRWDGAESFPQDNASWDGIDPIPPDDEPIFIHD